MFGSLSRVDFGLQGTCHVSGACIPGTLLDPTWQTLSSAAPSPPSFPLATFREHSQDLTSLFLNKGLIDY